MKMNAYKVRHKHAENKEREREREKRLVNAISNTPRHLSTTVLYAHRKDGKGSKRVENYSHKPRSSAKNECQQGKVEFGTSNGLI